MHGSAVAVLRTSLFCDNAPRAVGKVIGIWLACQSHSCLYVRLGALRTMEARARLNAWVVAAFLAVTLCCPRLATANPGCSLSDIGQAAKDTFTNVPASCAPQAADPAFYPLLGYIIALLQTPQGNQFCDGVENAEQSASGAEKQVAGYWSKLSADQQAKITEYVPGFADLSSGSADVLGAVNVVACACKTARWKGPGDLASDFGACVSDALCAAQDWFHDNISSDVFSSCSSTPPPPPQLIDCRVDPCAAGPHSCDLNVPVAGQAVQCYGGDPGFTCQGSFCFSESLFSTGQGNYCFCPPEMQNKDGFMYDIDGSCEYYVRCACPAGTQPLSASGSGAYICMCQDTGLPVNQDGSCPPPPPKCEPSCPVGQISKINDKKTCSYTCDCPSGLTKAGDKCVTPCADASQVMLASGACCAASQATSCGTCCPAGMKLDAGGQSCTSIIVPKGPFSPRQLPKLTPKKL